MENYSKLIIDGQKMINGRRFTYNIKTKEFVFEAPLKNFDEDILNFFEPRLNNDNDFKSRLENEIYKLSVTKGEFRYEASIYSKSKGLRYYSLQLASDNEDENIINGVIYDITNEKNMLSKMVHAEKLRSIGEIASGIAHDFNNHLMVITGSCELLEMQELNEKQRSYVKNIYQSAKKSSELIKRILQFGRAEDYENQEFDLIHIVNDAKDIMSHTTKNKTKIIFTTNLKDAMVVGNVSSIENAIINLIKNGIDAMNENGSIYIDLTAEYLDTIPPNSILSTTPEGFYYKLEIKDEGTGISEEIMDKIFNPFFTTKVKQKGTGLGLSTVLSTILEHEGMITVSSKKGIGSKFTLYFKTLNEPVLKKDRYHIMLVDDEEMVRSVISEVLTDLSYHVVSFSCASEALDYYKKNVTEVDVVISDMRMPNMNGMQLYKKLINLNPNLLFIMLSGFVDEITLEENENTMILSKPITVKNIDSMIKKLLKI